MKKFTIFLILVVMFIAAPVMAASPYVALKYSAGKVDVGDMDVEDNMPAPLDFTVDAGSSDKVTAGGIAVGLDFWHARVELEYFDKHTARYDARWQLNGFPLTQFPVPFDVATETFFVNLYLDIPVADWFELYVGGGVGNAKHNTDLRFFVPIPGADYSDSNTEFAWNCQAGMAFLFTDNFALDLGVRYADLGKADVGTSSIGTFTFDADSVRVKTKEAILALRYTF